MKGNPMFKSKKGQAIVELAIFGSLILFLFGALLSYLQRMNDQQYAEMEAFRRALQKACTYQGESSEGAGASVQYTLMQNRRLVDLTSGFRKGSPSSVSYSANVFWAVPKSDKDSEAESLIVYRINDDEKTWNYRDFVPKEHDSTDDEGEKRQRYWTFEQDNIETSSTSKFDEEIRKEEDLRRVINVNNSNLKENILTVLKYSIKEKDKDDKEYESVVKEDNLWEITQGLYRDESGQYKYSEAAVGTQLQNQKRWVTEF